VDYEKIYKSLILKRKTSILSENEYGEVHHIIPRCIGGTDDPDNLVRMTAEEHMIAHMLLIKIYPKESGLVYAANMMCNRVKNNKEYGWVRRRHAEELSKRFTGVPRAPESVEKQIATIKAKYENGYKSPSIGNILTEQHKKAISEKNTGREVPVKERSSLEGYIIRYGEEEGRRKYEEKNKKLDSSSIDYFIRTFGEELGTSKYEEYRQWSSDRMTGEKNPFFNKTHSDKSKAKMGDSRRGKKVKRTEEHNKKIGEANRGKKHVIVTCPHCGKEGGSTTMKQWHFDRCKQNPLGVQNKITRKVEAITCLHCGKTGTGPRMKSDHGDNCKHKR
jgi:hypothetical protein